MASAGEGSESNGVKIEAGDLSTEDAERFASEFKPSWEFDEAPFTALAATNGGATANEDLHALGAGGVNDEVAAALKAEMARAANRAPATSTLVMDSPKRPEGPPKRDPARPRPSDSGAHRTTPSAGQRPGARSASAAPQRVRAEDTGALLVPIKKSNKGILFAAIGVVAGLGLIFGIRAATSSPEVASPGQPTAPMNQKEEPRIPPPPPASDLAAASPTATSEPIAAPPPVVATATPVAPVPPPRVAAPPPQHGPPPTPVARVGHDRPLPPPAQPAAPKPPPKPPGGIVRDNPF